MEWTTQGWAAHGVTRRPPIPGTETRIVGPEGPESFHPGLARQHAAALRPIDKQEAEIREWLERRGYDRPEIDQRAFDRDVAKLGRIRDKPIDRVKLILMEMLDDVRNDDISNQRLCNKVKKRFRDAKLTTVRRARAQLRS